MEKLRKELQTTHSSRHTRGATPSKQQRSAGTEAGGEHCTPSAESQAGLLEDGRQQPRSY